MCHLPAAAARWRRGFCLGPRFGVRLEAHGLRASRQRRHAPLEWISLRRAELAEALEQVATNAACCCCPSTRTRGASCAWSTSRRKRASLRGASPALAPRRRPQTLWTVSRTDAPCFGLRTRGSTRSCSPPAKGSPRRVRADVLQAVFRLGSNSPRCCCRSWRASANCRQGAAAVAGRPPSAQGPEAGRGCRPAGPGRAPAPRPLPDGAAARRRAREVVEEVLLGSSRCGRRGTLSNVEVTEGGVRGRGRAWTHGGEGRRAQTTRTLCTHKAASTAESRSQQVRVALGARAEGP